MTNLPLTEFRSRFPISGSSVAEALSYFLKPEEVCYVDDIETLSSADSLELGKLWHSVSSRITLPMKFEDFARLISLADQVVTLSVSTLSAEKNGL